MPLHTPGSRPLSFPGLRGFITQFPEMTDEAVWASTALPRCIDPALFQQVSGSGIWTEIQPPVLERQLALSRLPPVSIEQVGSLDLFSFRVHDGLSCIRLAASTTVGAEPCAAI